MFVGVPTNWHSSSSVGLVFCWATRSIPRENTSLKMVDEHDVSITLDDLRIDNPPFIGRN
jgi:hypothetical protein